jgi:hypothetical protein
MPARLLAGELGTLEATAESLHQRHTRFIKNRIGDAFLDRMWMMSPISP